MATTSITIELLQNQIENNYFSFGLTNNGQPITFEGTNTLLQKTFRTTTDVAVGRRNITTLNNEALTDFGATTGAQNGFVYKVLATTISGQQKYYICGSFTSFNGDNTKRYLVRINADGSIDSTFTSPLATNGGTAGPVRDMALQDDNRLIIVGDFYGNGSSNDYSGVVRLTTAGVIDERFLGGLRTANGAYIYGSCVDFVVNGALKTIAIGTSNAFGKFYQSPTTDDIYRVAVFVMNSSYVYSTFQITPVNGPVNTIRQFVGLGDINFVIGGNFTNVGTIQCKNFWRYNDESTNPIFNGEIRAIELDGNNKVYVGGFHTTVNGTSSRYITALNQNNTVDTNFAPTVNGAVLSIELSGTNLYFGGSFNSVNGTRVKNIAKINTSAVVDSNFREFGYNSTVYSIAVTSNKLLVGGLFTSYAGGVASNTDLITIIYPTLEQTFENLLQNLNFFNTNTSITYTRATDVSDYAVRMTYTYTVGNVIRITNIVDEPDYIRLTLSDPNFGVIPTIIQSRSPFYVTQPISGNTNEVKFNLRIFDGNYNDDSPISPTYEFTKPRIKVNQDLIYIDVSNLTNEVLSNDLNSFLELTSYNAISHVGESETTWMKLDSAMVTGIGTGKTSGATTTVQYLATLGYGYTQEGVNPQPPKVLMSNEEKDIARFGHGRVYFNINGLTDVRYYFRTNGNVLVNESVLVSGSTSISNQYISSVRLKTDFGVNKPESVLYQFTYANGEVINKTFHLIDECEFTPMEVYYRNKNGFLENITFFKRTSREFKNDNSTYTKSILELDATFDPRQHSKVTYLLNVTEVLTLNTGYFDEYMNTSFRELRESDCIYINDNGAIRPCTITDDSWVPKYDINDEIISYTLKLEVATPVINNIQ